MTDQLSAAAPFEAPTPPVSAAIDLDDVSSLGNVDEALAAFYNRQVADVAEATGVTERAIRRWIETELISEQGFRTQSLAGAGAASPEVLAGLEDARLVRTESRRGTEWYELSHDRLVAPVRTSNEQWRAEHLSPLQNKAQEWVDHDRSDGLLISGDVLQEADEWAEAHPGELTAVEVEYLERCHEREEAEQALKRSSRRNLLLAILAGLLFLVGLVVAFLAIRNADEAREQREVAEVAETEAREAQDDAVEAQGDAEDQRDLAEAQRAAAQASELAARSRELQAENTALALAVAAEGVRQAEPVRPDAVRALVDARVSFDQLWSPVGSPTSFGRSVVGVSLDPGDRFVAVGEGMSLPIIDRATGEQVDVLTGHRGLIQDTAFSPDGEWLASAGEFGEVLVWQFDGSGFERVHTLDHTANGVTADLVHAVSFEPCTPGATICDRPTAMLAAGDDQGRVWLWDLSVEPPAGRVLERGIYGRDGGAAPGDVFDVEFRPDAGILASAEGDRVNDDGDRSDRDDGGQVVLWDVSEGEAIKRLFFETGDGSSRPASTFPPPEESAAYVVAFHPGFEYKTGGPPRFETDILVAGHADGTVHFWWSPNSVPLPGDQPTSVHRLAAHDRAVRALAFDPTGSVLASTSIDRTLKLWEPVGQPYSPWVALGPPLTQHEGWVSGVAFTNDGTGFVSSSGDTTVRRWALPAEIQVQAAQLLAGDDAAVPEAGAFDDDPPFVREFVHAECPTAEIDDPTNVCFATGVDISPDGTWMASSGRDGVIRLWNPRGPQGQEALELTARPADLIGSADGNERRMYGVAFSPTEDELVAAGHGRVWFWALADDSLDLRPLDYEPVEGALAVRAVDVDPEGKRAATVGDDGVVRLFDLEAGELVTTYELGDPEEPRLDAVVFESTDSLAVGQRSGEISRFTIVDGELVIGPPDIAREGDEILALASRTSVAGVDGDVTRTLFAAAGGDPIVSLEEVSAADFETEPLRGHADVVAALDFDRSGTLLASGSNDGTVRLWPLSAVELGPRPIAGVALAAITPELCGRECFVLDVAFGTHADGTILLASAGSDGIVRIWDEPWDPDRACVLAGRNLANGVGTAGLDRFADELGGLEPKVCSFG